MKEERVASKHVRRASAVLALAGTFALAYAGGAAAASATSAIGITAVINGQKFENQAVINVDTAANDAKATARVRGRSSVPSGHMGASARMYTAAGILVASSGAKYTTSTYSANTWFSVSTATKSTVNGTAYYSQGTTYHWNGSSYVSYTTLQSPSVTS